VTQDDFNALAWRDFVLWAWREPKLRAQFIKATGVELDVSPLDAAIDDATGAREERVSQFVEWVTREHWGLDQAPASYQQTIAKRARRP
jgi:hypothetical protein